MLALKRIQDISNLTRNISDLHRDISERDANIAALRQNVQDLIEVDRGKQTQIYSLQNSIATLQKEAQSSMGLAQIKEAKINGLQNQVSQLNQQKIELQQRIRDITKLAQKKQSQIENLQSEKSHLNTQKVELKQQYQILFQYYQQQQNEISDLKSQIKKSSQSNRLQSFNPTYRTPQQPVNRVETREKITLEEYKRIANQSDYEYVKPYNRKDGTPVSGYYRKRRNR